MNTNLALSALGVALLSPATAYAAPNYFNCRAVGSEGYVSEYRVTTDEDRSEVTFEGLSDGNVLKWPAIFTVDRVSWVNPKSTRFLTTRFSIRRVNLSFMLEVLIGGKDDNPLHGQCTKIAPPKRAF